MFVLTLLLSSIHSALFAADAKEADGFGSESASGDAVVAQSTMPANTSNGLAQSAALRVNIEAQNVTEFENKKSHSPLLLQGQVSNREKLQPIDSEFRTGATVDLTKLRSLKSLSADNHWDKIPSWAAGMWVEKTLSLFYKYSFALRTKDCTIDTYMAKSNDRHGFLKDKVGDIWEYRNKNYYTVTEFETQWGIDYVKDCEVLESDQRCMVMRFVSIHFNVDKYSKQIIANRQVESIQTYTPYSSNLMKIVSSQKCFDEDGRPLSLAKLLGFDLRVRPFAPVAQYKGKNMQKLFAEYLSTNGMPGLIPPPL
jgi:hypothetical protein